MHVHLCLAEMVMLWDLTSITVLSIHKLPIFLILNLVMSKIIDMILITQVGSLLAAELNY